MEDEQLIDRIDNAAGLILGVSENRTWIEIFFEGDLMHSKSVRKPKNSCAAKHSMERLLKKPARWLSRAPSR
jgi:hypothetical protein